MRRFNSLCQHLKAWLARARFQSVARRRSWRQWQPSVGQELEVRQLLAAVNAPPVLVTNSDLVVAPAGTATIRNSNLMVSDADNSATQLTYSLTTLTNQGVVKKDGTVVGWLFNPTNGHYYRSGTPTTWTGANAEATALGGYLTAIKDSAENQWLLSHFVNIGQAWIGLTDDGHEGRFTWTDGESLTFTSWHPGEPNGGGQENFVQMYLASTGPGNWNDLSNTDRPLPGIIERDNANGLLFGFTQDDINNNRVTYQHFPDSYTTGATASDRFNFTVSDGAGGTLGETTFKITVGTVNNAPIAVNDAFSTLEDTRVTTGNVLANDSDPDGDSLTISSFTQSSHGSVTSNGNGTFTYSPLANSNGADSFTYTINDGHGGTSTATVMLTITPVNDAPVAVNDSATTQEDTPVTTASLLTNDGDVDGDLLTINSFTQPSHGAVTPAGNGRFTYAPAANFFGTDSFTYTIGDGHSGTSTATVTLTVISVNDVPVATNDSAATLEDAPVTTANVLSNDSDVDGDSLTISSFTQPGHGSVISAGNGRFTYTPIANFFGTDSFAYTISDGHSGTSTATVTLTVTSVNDAPVAVNDAFSTSENHSVTTGNVLANDSDVDGDSLTISSFSQPSHGAVISNSNGTFQFTPQTNYHGLDNFTYTISDGHGGIGTATVTLNVTATLNRAPVAANDSASTLEDISVTTGNVLANDSDADSDVLQAGLVSGPAHGSLTLNANGTFTYAPNANYYGSDTFMYTANDGVLNSNVATVSLTITPVNDAPSFTKGAGQTVREDSGIQSVSNWATGINAGPSNEVTQAVDFLVTTTNTALFSVIPTVSASGTLTYIPAANANGLATVTVRVHDNGGTTNGVDTSAAQTFTITVTEVNDVSTFTKGADQSVQEDAGAQSISNWATNISTGPANEVTQVVDFIVTTTNDALFSALPAISALGTLTYTPAANANGTARVIVQSHDNGGTANGGVDTSAAQTFTIIVTPVNDDPIAMSDSVTTPANTIVTTGNVLANDSDVDGDSLTVNSFTQPAHGNAVDNHNGTFAYSPSRKFFGTDSFQYTISDGAGGFGVGIVTITVMPPTQIIFQAEYLDKPSEGFFDPTLGAGRRTSLEAAINIWSSLLPASYAGETITVSATMAVLKPKVLGGASPKEPFANQTGLIADTVYGGALANHLARRDLSSQPEIEAKFSSTFDFYYGTDGNVGTHLYDFESILLHEIGHGLNFYGELRTSNGSYSGSQNLPGIFDRHLKLNNGTALVDMTQAQRSTALVSNDLHWNGPRGIAGNNGVTPRLFAPSEYVLGSSIYHLSELFHGAELMSPAYSGVDHTLSAMELGMFADMGWDISPNSPSALALAAEAAELPSESPRPNAITTTFDRTTGKLSISAHAAVSLQVTAEAGEVLLLVNGRSDATTELIRAADVRSLQIHGSDDADQFDLTGVIKADFSGLNTIAVFAGAGDDLVSGSEFDDLLLGNDGNDTLQGGGGNDTIQGGAGQDMLDGGDGNDRLFGQAGNDTLCGQLGNDRLDGGSGLNKLTEFGNVNFTITNTSLSGVGTDTLANLQVAELTGGTGNNTFTVSSWNGTGSLTGGGGSDTVVASRNANFTLSDTQLLASNNLNLTLAAIGIANLTGGSGNNVLTVSGWTGTGTLDGSSGPADQIVIVRNADMTLTNTSLASSGFGTLSLTNIETANLSGGSSDNTLIAAKFTLGPVTLKGAGGDDVLIGGTKKDSLDGGSGRDLLIGGLEADTLVGGTGEDILIGGTSSLMANLPALNAIMTQWKRTDLTYAIRVANLRDGGVLNGTIKLNNSSVQDDINASDRLNGGHTAVTEDLDWFFQSTNDVLDVINNGITGEIQTPI